MGRAGRPPELSVRMDPRAGHEAHNYLINCAAGTAGDDDDRRSADKKKTRTTVVYRPQSTWNIAAQI